MMGRIEAVLLLWLICVVIGNGTWSQAAVIHFMKVFLVLSILAFHRQHSTHFVSKIAAECCYVLSSHLEFEFGAKFTAATRSNPSFNLDELLIYILAFTLYLLAETIVEYFQLSIRAID